MRMGLIHAYFGEGKGKTTAALGLGLRSAGQGMTVFMIQFLKSNQSGGELESVKRLEPSFKIFRFERARQQIRPVTLEESRKDSANAMQFARKVLSAHQCDVLILDEVLTAAAQRIVELRDVLELIERKPADMEMVVTGRALPDAIRRRAD